MKLLAYLGAAAAAVVILLLIAWTQQRRLLYFPEPDLGAVPAGWTEVSIATSSGLELTAWHRIADEEGAPLVLFFHGNGGNMAGRVPVGDALARRGFDVLLVEYRGYGGNPGSPSEAGFAEDAESAARFAAEAAPGRPIVYFGESLGAAVAVGLAATAPPDALILGSPFTSLADVGRYHYSWAPTFLVREKYPSLSRFESGSLEGIPVLVIAASADSVVPLSQSRAIADASGAEWYEVAGVDHNDPAIRSSSALADRVAEFITRVTR